MAGDTLTRLSKMHRATIERRGATRRYQCELIARRGRIYGTDNGVHMNSWPDGGMTPFRSEKNTNWEGAYRVPAMIRWRGRIQPGQVSNEVFAALDWFPTLLAAAGEPDIKSKLLTGY